MLTIPTASPPKFHLFCRGRAGGVTALSLSHNQRFLVTGGGDARVRVWDMRSREMVSAFVEHGGPITGLAVYRDDAHVISAR